MIFVDERKCTLCGDCVEACPWQALSIVDDKLVIDRELCAECGACLDFCSLGAICEVEPAPVAVVDASSKPILDAGAPAVARPVTPRGVSSPVSARPAVSPLWVSALPLAARFVGGLADWWLDRRRPASCDRRDYRPAPRGHEGAASAAISSAGPRRLRQRRRGRSGR
jgi:NAD-dependent dihydropyrimidine dehydrogenase PreA subunit